MCHIVKVNNLFKSDIIVENDFIDEETLLDLHSRTDEDENLYLSKLENSIDSAETESKSLGK